MTRDRAVAALLAAYQRINPTTRIKAADLARLFNCSRTQLATGRPDPRPGTLSTWLAQAAAAGVLFELQATWTPEGLRWTAHAAPKVLG